MRHQSNAALKLVEEPVRKRRNKPTPERDHDADFDFTHFAHYVVGVRTLWIEVIRRAAFDWVLYKNSRKMAKRQLAQDAYVWLFVEDTQHHHWDCRMRNDGTTISAFLCICSALDIDPEQLRRGIDLLTPTRIKTLGKLPMRRMRRDDTAEPGHDDLEVRMSCGAQAAQFLQEVRALSELSLDDLEVEG